MGLSDLFQIAAIVLAFAYVYNGHVKRKLMASVDEDLGTDGELDLTRLRQLRHADQAIVLRRNIRWSYLTRSPAETLPLISLLAPLDSHSAGVMLAETLGQNGYDDPEAVALALRIVDHRPEDDVVRVEVAEALRRLGDDAAALRLLDAAPNDAASVLLARAHLLDERGETGPALEAVSHALALFDQLPGSIAGESVDTAQFYAQQDAELLAARLRGGDNPVAQLKEMAATRQLRPDGTFNPMELGRQLEAQVHTIASVAPITPPRQTFPAALARLEADPHSADALRDIAVCELRDGNTAEAERWFDRLRTEDASRYEGHLGWAVARQQQERHARARAERLPPPESDEFSRWIDCWSGLGEVEQRVLGFVLTPFLPALRTTNVRLSVLPLGLPRHLAAPNILWFATWADTLDTTDWNHLYGLASWWWSTRSDPPLAELLTLAEPVGIGADRELADHLDDPALLLTACLSCWLEHIAALPGAAPLSAEVRAFCEQHFQTPSL